MSFDLYHCKAVYEPVDLEQFFTIDHFPKEAFSEYGFERFVRDVPRTEVIHTVHFLPDHDAWVQARRQAESGARDRVSFLLGTPQSCDAALKEIEAEFGLTRAEAWFSNTRRSHNGRHLRECFALYSRSVAQKGIYYVEQAQLGGGIKDDVYQKYQRDIFVDEPSFQTLPHYLEPSEAPPRLGVNPADLGSYVRGSSFLWVAL
jgi:hypothetical protein